MKFNKTAYIIIMIILMIGILAVPALADAGNFSGHSNFGGSSGSSHSSGALGVLVLGSSGGSAGGIIFIIIVAFVLINIMKNRRNAATSANTINTGVSGLMPMDGIRAIDPNFSEAAMKEKIANLYVQMQGAWQNKEFESMRPYMTDTLYNQFVMQQGELIRSDYTNYVERIAVLDVSLTGWRSDEINDAVVALVNTRIIDYTVDDKTGNVVSGSKTQEKFMCYEWTLIRSKGIKTAAPSGEGSEGVNTIHCPSCGAPIEMNQSAKCPYCDCVIDANDFDWAISAIKGISQRT
jgi:predicted lipid-binding transport protein (Tim44 family)